MSASIPAICRTIIVVLVALLPAGAWADRGDSPSKWKEVAKNVLRNNPFGPVRTWVRGQRAKLRRFRLQDGNLVNVAHGPLLVAVDRQIDRLAAGRGDALVAFKQAWEPAAHDNTVLDRHQQAYLKHRLDVVFASLLERVGRANGYHSESLFLAAKQAVKAAIAFNADYLQDERMLDALTDRLTVAATRATEKVAYLKWKGRAIDGLNERVDQIDQLHELITGPPFVRGKRVSQDLRIKFSRSIWPVPVPQEVPRARRHGQTTR